jgi:xylulokinase
MSLLGIDVGTSGCKAALFSRDGELLGMGYEEYDYDHPHTGWAELDAPRVWEQVQRTIRAAVTSAGGDRPEAVSVSSMGEAVVPVTRKRTILGPSILNFDVRGDEYLPRLSQSLSSERLYQINGNTLGSPYTLTKLIWVKQNQPDLYSQADAFLHWSGFVSYMLGAELHVDYSLANRTLLFDLVDENWSDELIHWAGLDREKLPPTVKSGKVVGTVSPAIADDLSLPAGIPIISGGHDQCCNSVGCGSISPGAALYGMGTQLCMTPVFASRPVPSRMIERGLNTEHHATQGLFVSFIYNQGGALVKWFRDTFAHAERGKAVESGQSLYPALFAEMPDEPSSVLVLPHFTTTGPPHFINDSSGVIAGLKLETTRGEILKGIVESATFYLRECFESLPGAGIEIREFYAAGGGSQADAWVQLSADILGRPFVRSKVHEAGSLGAAILAGTGAGVFPSIETAVNEMVHMEQRFEPDPVKQEQYNERFSQYHTFAALMENYLRSMNA